MEISNTVQAALHLLDEATIPFNYDDHIAELTSFVDLFRSASAPERYLMERHVGSRQCRRLLGFADYMADRAIRNNSVDDVERGLTAAVMAGLGYDYRMLTVTLSTLSHSSQKLGVDPYILFKRAAEIGSDSAREFLVQYLASGVKSIEAMNLREGTDENGQFKYVVIR